MGDDYTNKKSNQSDDSDTYQSKLVSGLMEAIQGFGGSGGAGAAGGAGGAGAAIAITAVTKILETISSVLTKIMNLIIDSSPYLQGVLKLIDKMFKLVLMPVGNMIAKILLPLAIKMASKTVSMMEKYGNSSPEDLTSAATDGFSIITESMVEMIGVVLGKVLVPILEAMVVSLGNVIVSIFSGGSTTVDFGLDTESYTEDLESLFGSAGSGVSSVVDQFGLSVITNNKLTGESAGELATVFYNGSESLEDGFQSTTSALVVGTTGAIDSLGSLNIANANLVTVVDTTTIGFTELVDSIYNFNKALTDSTDTTEYEYETTNTWDWSDWAQMIASPLLKTISTYASGDKIGGTSTTELVPMADGGIITKPTRILAGEDGAEAFIPLKNNSSIGTTVNNNFYGDTYGMDDFDSKVKKSVSKYSRSAKGAY